MHECCGTNLIGCSAHGSRVARMGFEPHPLPPHEFDPGSWRTRWQHKAASRVERNCRELSMLPVMSDSGKALWRSRNDTKHPWFKGCKAFKVQKCRVHVGVKCTLLTYPNWRGEHQILPQIFFSPRRSDRPLRHGFTPKDFFQ